MSARRVITGFDDQGRAAVLSDSEAPVIMKSEKIPGYEIAELCMLSSVPARLDGINVDGRAWELEPPAGGLVWRIVVRPPESAGRDDINALLQEVGAGEGDATGGAAHKPGVGGMHTTATVDMLVILSGQVWLTVGDEDEVVLGPGDFVLQGGVPHAWHNRGTVPCVMAGVMVGAV
jgi:mannose-6-phosphate isomerase-like protein (cupin superfamily)